MRKEPFTVDNFIHVFNRGNRKQPIVHTDKDRDRFLRMLYYFNTEETPNNLFQELTRLKLLRSDLNNFPWLKGWPSRKPIVSILSFTLMENHFHLLLKEIKDGGTARFMQKLGTGMTMYYNLKYQETGRLFQGAYKARCVDENVYLKYVNIYIQVKNLLELYPGGLEKAVKEFNKAYAWAINYSYSSLGDFVGARERGIIDKDIFLELFGNPEEYKEFARDCILHMNLDEKLEEVVVKI